MVQALWKDLNNMEETREKIAQVQEDVLQLFQKLLDRESTPRELESEARASLGL